PAAAQVRRSRADPARSRHPSNQGVLRPLEQVRRSIDARRSAVGPKEVRRGRTLADRRLRRDETTREVRAAPGFLAVRPGGGTRGAALRSAGKAGRGGEVAEGTEGAQRRGQEAGEATLSEGLTRLHRLPTTGSGQPGPAFIPDGFSHW